MNDIALAVQLNYYGVARAHNVGGGYGNICRWRERTGRSGKEFVTKLTQCGRGSALRGLVGGDVVLLLALLSVFFDRDLSLRCCCGGSRSYAYRLGYLRLSLTHTATQLRLNGSLIICTEALQLLHLRGCQLRLCDGATRRSEQRD